MLNSFILGTNPHVETVICLAPIAKPFESLITLINFIIAITISILIAICTSLMPTKIILSIHASDELKQ